ncbi:MAG: cytidine deaminase [Pseudomonadota bacterium]
MDLTQVFKMTGYEDDELIDAALAVRQNAYCPFSKFSVGAALIDEKGEIHVGCNVENSSYPEGSCAEANAIGAMIASGGKRIRRIVVAGGRERLETCTPCGGCRQRIAEFSDGDTIISIIGGGGYANKFSVQDLLPLCFRLEQ